MIPGLASRALLPLAVDRTVVTADWPGMGRSEVSARLPACCHTIFKFVQGFRFKLMPVPSAPHSVTHCPTASARCLTFPPHRRCPPQPPSHSSSAPSSLALLHLPVHLLSTSSSPPSTCGLLSTWLASCSKLGGCRRCCRNSNPQHKEHPIMQYLRDKIRIKKNRSTSMCMMYMTSQTIMLKLWAGHRG